MKKLFLILIFFLILTNLSCNSNQKILNVGVYTDYPPFSYKEENVIKGFNMDFLEICFKKMKYKPNYIEIDNDSFEKLKNGEVDVLIGGYPIAYKYPEGISLTEPYFDMSLYLISRITNPIGSIENLSDKKLVLSLYTFSEELIKNVKNIEKIPYKNFKDSLKLLEAGDIDAVLIEKVLLDIYSLDESKFIKVKVYNQGLTMVLREDDDVLRYEFNNSISNILKTKQYKNLILKWFEEER
ncbi:MAG: substrate-binding periplasmic protein [Caldisericia bacterium]